VELVAAAVPQAPAVVGGFSPAGLSQRALAKMVASNDVISAWVVDAQHQVLFQAGHPHPEAELVQHPQVKKSFAPAG